MNKFDIVFNRIDEYVIQGILGKQTLKIINILESDTFSIKKLKEVVLKVHSKVDILRNRETRNLVFQLLEESEANDLASILELDYKIGSVYKNLTNLIIRKNSDKEQKLFQFFDIDNKEDKNTNITFPNKEVISSNYSLFPYQREIEIKAKEVLYSDRPKVIIHMPTGSGKTRTAMNIISDHLRANKNNLVIWLAYSKELCEQAVEEFKKAWKNLGNTDLSVVRFWGTHDFPNEIDRGVVVCSILKLYNASKYGNVKIIRELSGKVSLVVFDEAHQSIADTYKHIINMLLSPTTNKGKSLLGLTATPGRSYNDMEQDKRLANFYGAQKVTFDPPNGNFISFLIEQGFLAKVTFKELTYESNIDISEQEYKSLKEQLEIPNNILSKLEKEELRNLAIINVAIKIVKQKKHKRLLIFATTVNHSRIIADILSYKGLEAYSVTSQTERGQRENIIQKYKGDSEDSIILCNYGVLTTGFDAPRTSAAIIARPTKSLIMYCQMIGRAIRGERIGGNKESEIWTVIDRNLPGFRDFSEAFYNWDDVY